MKYLKIILMMSICFWGTGELRAAEIQESTLSDQKNVEVTVYNQNVALIKDTRLVNLPKGEGELRFMDVAAYILPVTVHVKSLNIAEPFVVLEQNYEYDLLDPGKLMDKYVGKKIKLMLDREFQDRKDIVEAELLSYNNREPVYKIDGEIYLGHRGSPILPEIPDNLIAKPTLTWQYRNQSLAPQELEVSYLTDNMTWQADYVLVLDQNDTGADFSGWVTIDNRSGTLYENAVLKLVAGEINRAGASETRYLEKRMVADMAAAAPQFQEKEFFDYHIYDLQRPTTLKNNQTKQISLLEAAEVRVKKEYLIYGQQGYYNRQYYEQSPKQPVKVYVKFKNAAENHLGMPLPQGVVRLYKKDDESKLQFVGEDKINHTPKDEEVSLQVGEAFDVVAQRRQTDFKQITTQRYESEWEILVRNHKAQPVTVGVIEPMPGSWAVINSSHLYEKKDAFTLRFDVTVPPDGETKVSYRVSVGI